MRRRSLIRNRGLEMISTTASRRPRGEDPDAVSNKHPQAYKPTETVTDDAKDLGDVVHTLRQSTQNGDRQDISRRIKLQLLGHASASKSPD